ncbi:MAG TPA: MogA/MoaB family molybdenum cofactor biosynthesis protein [Bacillus sp. (in: firmicutes)]|nr:MogA/MoaB family molybdenum cofactor biosynthesis protein [Bacillus sp. (in: firmicutes)]
MSHKQHIVHAPNSLRCAVITVSDTRTEETDKSGQRIISLLQEQDHDVRFYKIVKDDRNSIREALLEAVAQEDLDALITNGGTGIARRDVTIETVKPLLEKEIVGFGELFRMLSYTEDIGPAAMLSRAIAGVREQKIIFSLPGSTGAVTLAMNKLILPELRHVISEIRK